MAQEGVPRGSFKCDSACWLSAMQDSARDELSEARRVVLQDLRDNPALPGPSGLAQEEGSWGRRGPEMGMGVPRSDSPLAPILQARISLFNRSASLAVPCFQFWCEVEPEEPQMQNWFPRTWFWV